MSDFDPYHIWLGIPVTERPISKYRMLGLTDFEVDRNVISAAAAAARAWKSNVPRR